MLRLLLLSVIVSGSASAGVDLICPASVVAQATYDPATGLTPDLSTPAWTFAFDDGSTIAVEPVLGVPALHVIDSQLPALADGSCQAPTPGSEEGTFFVLFESALSTSTVFGIEARFAIQDECFTGLNDEFHGEAGFGASDGDRVAAASVEGPSNPMVSFVEPSTGQNIVSAPLLGFDTTPYHTYTVRCERGVRCAIYLDGSATPALQISYGALPPASSLPLPLPPDFSGGFVFGSNRADVAWARVDVIACEGDRVKVAIATAIANIQETAQVISTTLDASVWTKLVPKLTGSGGAKSKFDASQVFVDQGKICDAVAKQVAGVEKLDAATIQYIGFPNCSGAKTKNCRAPSTQNLVLTSLLSTKTQAEAAKITTCSLGPTCAGCPAAPVLRRLEVSDMSLLDGTVDRVCVVGDQAASRIDISCDVFFGVTTTSFLTSTKLVSGAVRTCTSDVNLPASCGASGPYFVEVTAIGVTGLRSASIRRPVLKDDIECPPECFDTIDGNCPLPDPDSGKFVTPGSIEAGEPVSVLIQIEGDTHCTDESDDTAVVLMLDESGSMDALSGCCGVFDQRFEVSREAALVVAESTLVNPDSEVALRTFDTSPTCSFAAGCSLCSFVSDPAEVETIVGPLGDPAGGCLPSPSFATNLEAALDDAVTTAATSALPNKVVLMFTDGDDTFDGVGDPSYADIAAAAVAAGVEVYPFCVGACGEATSAFVDLVEETAGIDIDESDANLCPVGGAECPCLVIDSFAGLSDQLLCTLAVASGQQPVRNVRVFEKLAGEFDVVAGTCSCGGSAASTIDCFDACAALASGDEALFPNVGSLGEGEDLQIEFDALHVGACPNGGGTCPEPDPTCDDPDGDGVVELCLDETAGLFPDDLPHVAYNFAAEGIFYTPECPGLPFDDLDGDGNVDIEVCGALDNEETSCEDAGTPISVTKDFDSVLLSGGTQHWRVRVEIKNNTGEPIDVVRVVEALTEDFQVDRERTIAYDFGDLFTAVAGTADFYEYLVFDDRRLEACEASEISFFVRPVGLCVPGIRVERLTVNRANMHPSLTSSHVLWAIPAVSPSIPAMLGCALMPSIETPSDFPGLATCGLEPDAPSEDLVIVAPVDCSEISPYDDVLLDGNGILPGEVLRLAPLQLCADLEAPPCCFLPRTGGVTTPFKGRDFISSSVPYCGPPPATSPTSPVVACGGSLEAASGCSCDPTANAPCCGPDRAEGGCFGDPACCYHCTLERDEGGTVAPEDCIQP